MIKVLFLIDTLGGGGAERVLVNLVNNMDISKFDITVETLFDDGVNLSLLSERVKYISKKAPHPKGISTWIKFVSAKRLFRYFVGKNSYDVVIAYMHGICTKVVAGCTDNSTKCITWLHTGNPEKSSFFKPWFFKKNAIDSYRKCDAVVGVSNTVKESFSDYTGISERLFVVYNTNESEKILIKSHESCQLSEVNSTKIVTVGKLNQVKGFYRLVKVADKLLKEGFDFNLYILGEGPDKRKIEDFIHNQNIENNIHLLGFDSNPYKYLASSDIFVCSSYFEGLSTATTEALIVGNAIVSTDVSGAKEILGYNNEYGIVVENNDDSLYEGLKKLLLSKELTDMYKASAKEHSVLFSTGKTVKQAEQLIEKVYNQ